MRTDEQIVEETNILAGYILANLIGTGYKAPPGYRFYNATGGRQKSAWVHAVNIMEMITQTDANDALSAIEPDAAMPTNISTVVESDKIPVMKVYTVHASHSSVPGNPMRPHATKALADVFAAECVNMILTDYTDDETDQPIIPADATAETWEEKCLEYRQSIADDLDCDLDDLEDDDAGDVWIITDELVGGDELYTQPVKTTPLPRLWNAWEGGDEAPLPFGHAVDVLLRCGHERHGNVGELGYARRWTHLSRPDDIMGYIPIFKTFSADAVQTIKGVKSTSLDAVGIDVDSSSLQGVRGKLERPR